MSQGLFGVWIISEDYLCQDNVENTDYNIWFNCCFVLHIIAGIYAFWQDNHKYFSVPNMKLPNILDERHIIVCHVHDRHRFRIFDFFHYANVCETFHKILFLSPKLLPSTFPENASAWFDTSYQLLIPIIVIEQSVSDWFSRLFVLSPQRVGPICAHQKHCDHWPLS